MPEVVDLAADAVVIRFAPTSTEAVLKRARMEFRRAQHYGLSVFADSARPGESRDQLIARLLDDSQLAGIDPLNNKKYYVCAKAGNLVDSGFVLVKDGSEEGEAELPTHYCVNLGEEDPSVAIAATFLAQFDGPEKREP
ncbi:hypothetical protein SAMN04488570_0304 [Nocardioides scoriae]|uniref:Uncharacterized protein n=1 Tax=Nocardioides scoriae TaxID=642780 RepID=A0A1H1LPU2_9ACTN|nr:hypothetical protein [Nocardioides scoriae]SDR76340.1 hypothetical protein SAMN04488570_0304 [Nocardioides scoriae]